MASGPVNSPLTDQHLEDINNALAQLKVAEQQINLAKAAGIDVSQHEQDLKDTRAQLQKVKQVYFPGR